MNRRIPVLLALLFATVTVASAQEFDPEHRSALELSAGYAPLQALMMKYDGQSELTPERFFSPAVSLAYVFQFNETWSFQAAANISGNYYKLLDENGAEAGREFANLTPTAVLSLRYCWLKRKSFTMYSTFGVGLDPEILLASFFPAPIPNIAPLGIKFGKGKVYGIAEALVGSAATGLIFGIGCRL